MPQWFIFIPAARAQLRAIDKIDAKRILDALNRLRFGHGDVENVKGSDPPQKRFCVGAYRIIYRELSGGRFEIQEIGKRAEIYR
jgi:mRNA-degrading endonuclease RelE of RelBE toxin-antitoxin system